jgi:hypothetical protein
MTIEQDLKQILQPYKQNATEYSTIINKIILEKFKGISETDTPSENAFFEALYAKADLIMVAKREFETKQSKIVIPKDISIDFWAWQEPSQKELFNNIYADTVIKGDDQWHVQLHHYQEHIPSIIQALVIIPGCILQDRAYIHFERKTPSKKAIFQEDRKYIIEFNNGTITYNPNASEDTFIAKDAPESKITTELKNSYNSKIFDIDTVHFNISELGSGALDAILYDLKIND